ncbi:hypothetical protein HK096_004783, partial [Nowakowskiella sp. JEL0078]
AIDEGKDPDLFTKSMVQTLVAKNQKINGRIQMIKSLLWRHPHVIAALTKTGAINHEHLQSFELMVDLASESGEVMDLLNKPKDSARKYLDGRGVYILVRVIGGYRRVTTPICLIRIIMYLREDIQVSSTARAAKGKRGHMGMGQNGLPVNEKSNMQNNCGVSILEPENNRESEMIEKSFTSGVVSKKGKSKNERISVAKDTREKLDVTHSSTSNIDPIKIGDKNATSEKRSSVSHNPTIQKLKKLEKK